MEKTELNQLSDEALLIEAKKIRSTKIYDSLIFGVIVGIAVYSTVKNGFGLLTFLPIVYLPVAGKNKKKRQELEEILAERNLE